MSNQSDLAKSAAGFNGDPLSIDTANNRVGIGTSSPSNPITIDAANALGSTFTGTTAGEGIRVRQTSYTADNYVSLIEAPYVNTASQPAVRIGAKFNGGGSSLAFGTTNNYASGITNTAMTIDSSGNVGIGTSSPDQTLHVHKGSAGTVASHASSVLTLENSTTGILQFLTPNTAAQQIRFGDPQDDGAGIIQYDHSTNVLQFNANGPERMRINSSGNLLVGTTSTGGGRCVLETTSTNQLVLSNKDTGADAQYAAYFLRNNSIVGSIQTSNTSSSFVTSSDYRLKENVTDVTDGITRVKQLEPKRFNFIADPDRTVDGFLAHEAQSVVPEAVTGTHNEVDADGNPVYQGIDQSKLVPLLTAALQEAIAKIETLETEMTSVKARLDALEGN